VDEDEGAFLDSAEEAVDLETEDVTEVEEKAWWCLAWISPTQIERSHPMR